jgi:choline dehydrogenase-like flavoprotein
MLIDINEETPNGFFQADVCIVGTGPAGLSLARELSRTDLRICLLESGGQKPSPRASSLNEGSVDSPHGYRAEILRNGRRRQLGGSSNLWNHELRGLREKFVRYVALDEIDFEQRDWIPGSGWPFTRSDLVPFYERAHKICGIGPFADSPEAWRGEGSPGQAWQTDDLESVVSQFGSPNIFLKDHLAQLNRAANVYIFAQSTLMSLNADEAHPDVISSAEVARADGVRFRVKAPCFVLAAGGLENARILLLNKATRSGGPGNQHDMVGRYYMDHPAIALGTLVPSCGAIYEQAAFYDQHYVDGQLIMGKLHLRQEVLRRDKLLNSCVVLAPHFRNLGSHLPATMKQIAAKGLRFLLHRCAGRNSYRPPKAGNRGALSLGQRLLAGYYSEGTSGWSRTTNQDRRFGKIGLHALTEQSPDPANRIILGEKLDASGQRQEKILWRLNEIDLRSIRRTQEIFQHELAAAGIGAFTPLKASEDGIPTLSSPHHFLGSTRMHDDPRQGVVDANCQVHGLKNLFVAGGSLFPTGGFANPTLTIVALALRLADHLREAAVGATMYKLSGYPGS